MSGSFAANGSANVSGSVYIPGSKAIPAISIDQHELNVDPNPKIIAKKPRDKIKYVQNVSLKFLRPPPPPKAGDITIIQESDIQTPAVPPIRIVQKPHPPRTPSPIIIHEKPPKPPAPIPEKHVTIPGRVLPPPPRQVIVERLPPVPPKPRDLIIERWLGYKRRIRRVEFKPASPPVLAPKPKNIIIEWDTPNVSITKSYINLGLQRVDPQAYLAEHGENLTDASQLPEEASYIQPPEGEVLAALSDSNLPPIYCGDVSVLKLINIECL